MVASHNNPYKLTQILWQIESNRIELISQMSKMENYFLRYHILTKTNNELESTHKRTHTRSHLDSETHIKDYAYETKKGISAVRFCSVAV